MITSVYPDRPPTAGERRAFVGVACVYAMLTLAILPFATVDAPHVARIALVYGSAILLADGCTALLLAIWYRDCGKPALLALTCGYAYSAIMAVLHVVEFPGAIFARPLFGSEQTVGWLYLAWRGGSALCYLAAVLLAARAPHAAPEARNRGLRWAGGGVTVACVFIALAASAIPFDELRGRHFTAAGTLSQWIAVALSAAALALIVRRRAFGDVLYWWLGLVLVAAIADLVLSNVGGARYSVGWHVSRASFVMSALLLLAFLVSERSAAAGHSRAWSLGAYGAALATVLAAILLRWFLDPWLGHGVPYITLYPAVAVAVWMSGWAPAVLATATGYWVVNVLYMEPLGASRATDAEQALQFMLFSASSLMIIALGESMRRARDRLRASEAALLQRTRELERADANKSNFLALLSHELRNPLAPIRTGLTILKLATDAAVVEKTRGMIERQVGHLTRLVDDLLDVSRIDRGKLGLKPERMEIDAAVRSAIETSMPEIKAKSLDLTVRHSTQPLYVDADPVRLAQVFANLLNNAAKFSAPGGRIELVARAADGHAVVTVSDTGIGIAPEQLANIFELFFQVGSARTTAVPGLGIGLTLVRSIVEQHGGTAAARSAGLGHGAEFEVRLPLVSSKPSPSLHRGDAALPASGRRILVVDDNVDAGSTIAELLRLHGHRVELAFGGDAALRAAVALRPELAFIDLDMPGMDGYELARRLRAESYGRATRLVALTGMGQRSDIGKTRAAGFEIHLTKPADSERVLHLAGE